MEPPGLRLARVVGCASVAKMRTRFFLSFGVGLVSSLLVVACVADVATVPRGDLNGPCFVNGTCNAGLRCDVVNATAKCVPLGDAAPADAAPTDASPISDGGKTDSGLPVCSFTPTSFPCQGGPSATACFGATQTCSITGCSGNNDEYWSCFSANQCSTRACCLSASKATLAPGTNCSPRALSITPGITTAATCASGATCGAGDTQLCESNAQCPAGKICTAVNLVSLGDGGAASLNSVILGACAPP